jgi:hypothetical protein
MAQRGEPQWQNGWEKCELFHPLGDFQQTGRLLAMPIPWAASLQAAQRARRGGSLEYYQNAGSEMIRR